VHTSLPITNLGELDQGRIAFVNPWSGRRVIVVGAARQGLALAKYLARHDATVVLNDRLPDNELRGAQQALAGENIQWVCGGHPLSLLDGADLVCLSGGIPLDLPIVKEARRRGIRLSNDSQIFLEEVPCPVVGITGSAGKTTTTTLVGRIAQAAAEIRIRNYRSLPPLWKHQEYPSKVWVGGNIGLPLISTVEQMVENDLAVMELSSFQLEIMERVPQVAAILNITPNHLDRHANMEAYQAAKARILDFQSFADIAVLNRDDPGTWNLVDHVRGNLITFGRQRPAPGQTGTFLSEDGQSLLLQSVEHGMEKVSKLFARQDILLRGEHNLFNVLAAGAIAFGAGLPIEAVIAGVNGFSGVPHRLEFVRTWSGADWFNDSIATAPERAIAAIHSFSEPLVLLAGGRDKNLPWEDFANQVATRVKHLILFGESADKIAQAMITYAPMSKVKITHCSNLFQAVQAAAKAISPGDVVLFSPGGTSFDEFRDFEARGEAYKKWVMELP
jgi:UDP-N-acetylmuramoylalanine--D-glutamate ligase